MSGQTQSWRRRNVPVTWNDRVWRPKRLNLLSDGEEWLI
jgi:hypothetical protein